MGGRRRRPQLVRRRLHQHALAQREQGKRLQRSRHPRHQGLHPTPSSNFGTITGAGLRDEVEGQSWLLKRLVGNIFCQYVNADGNSDPSQFWRQALVTAGFFVSRNIDSIQGEPDLDYDEYDPMFLDNITNPWIWRRSWILSNPEGNVVRDDFPIANSNYVGTQAAHTSTRKSSEESCASSDYSSHSPPSNGTASGVKSSPLALAKVRFTPTSRLAHLR